MRELVVSQSGMFTRAEIRAGPAAARGAVRRRLRRANGGASAARIRGRTDNLSAEVMVYELSRRYAAGAACAPNRVLQHADDGSFRKISGLPAPSPSKRRFLEVEFPSKFHSSGFT